MKRCKLLALLILVCLLMLPVCVSADTQLEFELRCNKKTAAATTVYNSANDDHYITDNIPAGTYVQYWGTARDGWVGIIYMKDGVQKRGWAQVKIIDCSSKVRKSDGFLYNVHEKDPNYSLKIKQRLCCLCCLSWRSWSRT